MTKEQIDWLKTLDPERIDGTIQSILMGEKLNEIPFEGVARKLISRLFAEKRALAQDNIRLSQQIHGMSFDTKLKEK